VNHVPDRPGPSGAISEKIFLTLACFAAGAGIMIVELAGNRLITPVFGNTMFTWTGLISVVLVAIALGDYLGGWLVDRRPDFHTMGILFFAAGISIAVVFPVFLLCREWLSRWSPVTGPIWASLVLFSVPAIFLAAVSPFTVRLLSKEFADRQIGLSAGLVGMWGTLGSFVGTVGAGLYLIPRFSLPSIFFTVAVFVFCLGIVAVLTLGHGWRNKSLWAACSVFAAALLWLSISRASPLEGEISRTSSFYHDIIVRDQPRADGKTVRTLQLDTTMEGAQIVETGDLVFGYQHFWRLLTVFGPSNPRQALFLGGGGFGMPRHVSMEWPDCEVTIVELDEAVIEVGKKFFRLDEFPSFRLEAQDARRFLAANPDKWDLVIGDAYSGVHTVPSHLTSFEFFQLVRERLHPEGVFFMNLISASRGSKGAAFGWLLATIQQVFQDVRVFAVVDPLSPEVQNLILIASDADLDQRLAGSARLDPVLLRMLKQQIPEDLLSRAEGKVIFDTRNPMEWLMARQITALP
jgi:spermidine synthase